MHRSYHHRRKNLTGLGDRDDALLWHIGFGHFNDGNAALFLRGILGHIEIDRLGIDDIAVGSLNLNQSIAGAIFKRFGGNQITLIVGIESVDGGHFGVAVSTSSKVYPEPMSTSPK